MTKEYFDGEVSSGKVERVDCVWISNFKVSLSSFKHIGLIVGRFKLDAIVRAIDKLHVWSQSYSSQGRANVGLIHSDLHRKNILVDPTSNKRVTFIDFDDAIESYYELDVAVILNELEEYHNKDKLKARLLSSYGYVCEDDLDNLQKLANLLYIEWVFNGTIMNENDFEKKVKFGYDSIENLMKIN